MKRYIMDSRTYRGTCGFRTDLVPHKKINFFLLLFEKVKNKKKKKNIYPSFSLKRYDVQLLFL